MNLKKIGIIAIALIALSAIVIATLGDELTATEFANIDIDNHDFKIQDSTGTLLGEGTTAIYSNNFPIETFQKQEDGKYKEVPMEITAIFEIEDYSLCRLNGETEENCKQKMHDIQVDKITSELYNEKERLKKLQDSEKAIEQYASEIKSGDITITAQELLTAEIEP